ncbi:MAG: hypothetical protein MUE71_00550 [Chitinophagaceae bacterium]|nr:hypothetical protein [Chitinophagaceae bacterium]
MRILFLLLILSGVSKAQAQLPAIKEKTKSLQAMPGYLPMYFEESTGKLFIQINRWNEELLYHISLPQGLGSNDIGLDRGLQGAVIMLRKGAQWSKALLQALCGDLRLKQLPAIRY